jgi:hypothetical protein
MYGAKKLNTVSIPVSSPSTTVRITSTTALIIGAKVCHTVDTTVTTTDTIVWNNPM